MKDFVLREEHLRYLSKVDPTVVKMILQPKNRRMLPFCKDFG
jgi:hypothetical protein